MAGVWRNKGETTIFSDSSTAAEFRAEKEPDCGRDTHPAGGAPAAAALVRQGQEVPRGWAEGRLGAPGAAFIPALLWGAAWALGPPGTQ